MEYMHGLFRLLRFDKCTYIQAAVCPRRTPSLVFRSGSWPPKVTTYCTYVHTDVTALRYTIGGYVRDFIFVVYARVASISSFIPLLWKKIHKKSVKMHPPKSMHASPESNPGGFHARICFFQAMHLQFQQQIIPDNVSIINHVNKSIPLLTNNSTSVQNQQTHQRKWS